MKITITGAHGSGKTTICNNLVEALKKQNKDVYLMPEVGRGSPYLLKNELSSTAETHIFASQIKNELECVLLHDIVVVDRSIIDQAMYTELFFPKEKIL